MAPGRQFVLAFNRLPLRRHLRAKALSRVVLLPLTSDEMVVAETRRELEAAGASVEVLDSAELVEAEAAVLRRGVAAWSAAIGRAVRQRLWIGDAGLSAWWFGLIAEKSPFKTDAFLRIAQLRAAKAALAVRPGYSLAWAVSESELADALALVDPSSGECFSPPGRRTSIFFRVLQALKLWVISVTRGVQARAALGPRSRRWPAPDSILFAAYFPGWDAAAAARGRFRSRYAGALHDLLERSGIPAAWLLTYAELDGLTWGESLASAERMVDSGEKIFTMEEFIGCAAAAGVLGSWLAAASAAATAWRGLGTADLFFGPVPKEAAPIVRALWERSFYGAPLMEGLLASSAYRAAFAELTGARSCVFWSEGHGWEKALVAAARARGLKTAGFQHGSLLSNLFNYFPDASEAGTEPGDLPLPDVYACDGEIPRRMLDGTAWHGLTRVEALRYLPLAEIAARPAPLRPSRRTLLVAGSIDAAETRSLVEASIRAFLVDGQVRLLFRSHPAQPFEGLLESRGLLAHPSVSISTGTLGEALEACDAVLTGSSGVGLEALAYGRGTIVLRRPDALTMNPLADFPEQHLLASSVAELATAFDALAAGADDERAAEGRRFLARYWDLDRNLPGWKGLLKSLRAPSS